MKHHESRNLAKVGVEGSNTFARSKFPHGNQSVMRRPPQGGLSRFGRGVHMVSTATRPSTNLAQVRRPRISEALNHLADLSVLKRHLCRPKVEATRSNRVGCAKRSLRPMFFKRRSSENKP